MSHVHQLTWEDSGTLSRLEVSFDSGVYLFVYQGGPDRVVYVGTAESSNGFAQRWFDHLKLFNQGGRTVWRPGTNEDIYNLMTQTEPDYMKLCKEGKVWIPHTKFDSEKGCYFPLHEGPSFLDEWRPYILNEYLPRISVWRCRIVETDLPIILESQIQLVLRNHFGLTYYKPSKQTWLGKLECSDKSRLSPHRFRFQTLPNVDEITRGLLKDLGAKL